MTYAKSRENEETDVFIGRASFIQHGATRLVYFFVLLLDFSYYDYTVIKCAARLKAL